MAVTGGTRRIVGGVDTHKDLHVAAVVDEQDRVIGRRSFATTRQGYWLKNQFKRSPSAGPSFYNHGRVPLIYQTGKTVQINRASYNIPLERTSE